MRVRSRTRDRPSSPDLDERRRDTATAVWKEAPDPLTLSGMPLRVLIVDDQPEFRVLAREVLGRRGFDVVGEAGCGASAVASAVRHRPDAVLLDMHLGEESGLDVARALDRECPGTAVLLVSCMDNGFGGEGVEIAGVAGFLHKSCLVSADLRAYWDAGSCDRDEATGWRRP
jgi:two-component system nitrate/nitrite response regulator NarL